MISLYKLSSVLCAIIILLICIKNGFCDEGNIAIIAKKHISKSKLESAVSKLSSIPSESPLFWTRIANDPGYEDFHRRIAILQLFKRHIKVKTKLNDLAKILNRPTWIRLSDIDVIRIVAGKVPIRLNGSSTSFVMRVLPIDGNQQSAIYIRLSREISETDLTNIVVKGIPSRAGEVVIAEIACVGFSQRDHHNMTQYHALLRK